MKNRIVVLIGLVIYAGSPLLAQEPSTPEAVGTVAWLKTVAAELRNLRKELMEERIERQAGRVREIERELQQTRGELQNSEEVLRAQNQEIIQLDQRLSDPELPSEERSELASVRTEAAATNESERTANQEKEARIRETLRREQIRLESLRTAARALTTSAAKPREQEPSASDGAIPSGSST